MAMGELVISVQFDGDTCGACEYACGFYDGGIEPHPTHWRCNLFGKNLRMRKREPRRCRACLAAERRARKGAEK